MAFTREIDRALPPNGERARLTPAAVLVGNSAPARSPGTADVTGTVYRPAVLSVGPGRALPSAVHLAKRANESPRQKRDESQSQHRDRRGQIGMTRREPR